MRRLQKGSGDPARSGGPWINQCWWCDMSTRVAVGSENTARTFRLCSLGLHRTPIIFWPNPEEVPFHLPEWIKKNTWFESLQGFISEAQLVGHRNEAFLQLVVATGQRVVIRGQGRFLKWDTFVPRTKVRTRRFVRRGQHTPSMDPWGTLQLSCESHQGCQESSDCFLSPCLLAQTGTEGSFSLLCTLESPPLSVSGTREDNWVPQDSFPYDVWNVLSACDQFDVP